MKREKTIILLLIFLLLLGFFAQSNELEQNNNTNLSSATILTKDFSFNSLEYNIIRYASKYEKLTKAYLGVGIAGGVILGIGAGLLGGGIGMIAYSYDSVTTEEIDAISNFNFFNLSANGKIFLGGILLLSFGITLISIGLALMITGLVLSAKYKKMVSFYMDSNDKSGLKLGFAMKL